MGLKEAIGRDSSSFHYYGVYDEEVDYDTVDIKNGTYVIEDLERELSWRSEQSWSGEV